MINGPSYPPFLSLVSDFNTRVTPAFGHGVIAKVFSIFWVQTVARLLPAELCPAL